MFLDGTPCLCSLLLMGALLGFSGCATIRTTVPRPVTYALPHPETTKIGRALASQEARHPGQSGFHLLEFGREALIARIALADAAEKTIDAQYYIYDSDEAGSMLALSLIQAADRGVRVRLLVDDSPLEDAKEIAALCAHPNIEVRVFNPFVFRERWLRPPLYAFDYHSAVHRMHNKIFLVDNEVAILGGRNIANHYFEINTNSNFRDFDIMMAGRVSQQASSAFDEYWNSSWAIPAVALIPQLPTQNDFNQVRAKLERTAKNITSFSVQYAQVRERYVESLQRDGDLLVWAKGEIIIDPPKKIKEANPLTSLVAERLNEEWAKAQKDIIVEVAYLIPGKDGLQRFRELRARGVNVQVLTSSLDATDVPLVYSGYKRYRFHLLEAGVDLYEYKAHTGDVARTERRWYRPKTSYAALHSKVLLFDHRKVWIGSFNLDPRSEKLNTEIALLVESPQLSAQLASYLAEDMKPARSWHVQLEQPPADEVWPRERVTWTGEMGGRIIKLSREPAGWTERVKMFFLSQLPGIESLL